MATASIRVSGPGADRMAGELRVALGEVVGPGEAVTPVELERSVELVVAVIGLVFSGIGTAKTLWDWWEKRRSEGIKVSIILDDGTHLDLEGLDGQRLEIELQRRATSTR